VAMHTARGRWTSRRCYSSMSVARLATALALSWVIRAPLAPVVRTGPPADGVCGGPTLMPGATGASAPGSSVASFIENG
jgi:hypothetical protein